MTIPNQSVGPEYRRCQHRFTLSWSFIFLEVKRGALAKEPIDDGWGKRVVIENSSPLFCICQPDSLSKPAEPSRQAIYGVMYPHIMVSIPPVASLLKLRIDH